MKENKRNLRLKGLLCLGLGLITLAVYLPAIRHDFLDYDDQQYVTENSHVQAGLTAQSLVWAFNRGYASNWHPLTWLSHMLDCQFYGLKPAGHHLANVLLHLANTLLLFLALQRMTGAAWRSAFVAALFAWHPLHVESVAWVAERKDVLSAFFWMLTLCSYIWYAAKPDARRYLITLILFALGLMSKPMVVTLPFVLLLLDYWPLKRTSDSGFRISEPGEVRQQMPSFHWKLLALEKIPFLALSAICCALTVSAQWQGYSIVSTAGLPLSQRVSHAMVSYLHYVGAMFLPRHLAVYYPYEIATPVIEIVGAGILLALISVLCVWFASRRPYLLVGWLWYLGTLVPVIGLVQVGDQAWADRYTYLPLIGLFIIVVWGAVEVGRVCPRPAVLGPQVLVFRAIPVCLGLALLIGTSIQLSYWKNTRALFEHAAHVTRHNHVAITLLGSLLAKDGKLDEAMEYYRTALRYKPRYAEAHFFLGNALDQRDKLDEAIAEYQQALWFKPTQKQTHILLGVALAKQKKYDDAAIHYSAALKLNPESAVAHNNLARLRHTQGRLDEAIDHYFAALKLDPSLAQAHNNLGILLLQEGRLTEGIAQLREASRLNPGNQESQYNLAVALNRQGQWSEAAELFAKTVGGASNDPNAQYQFGLALAHLQKTREAMSHYASALLVQPDFPDALAGLAWILATTPNPELRNGTEAVRMAERASELTGRKDPVKLKTLAAAYAEAGHFDEALDTVQKAQDLAASAGQQEIVKECQRLLENFKKTKPWRETRAGQ